MSAPFTSRREARAWDRAAVDLELGLQRLPALPEAREVEIGKLDVLFYLERAVTDKEHMRSVRLDVLHRLSGKAPGLAFQER